MQKRVIQIPKHNKKSFKPFLFLYRSLKKENIDVIHAFDSMNFFYSLFAAKLLNI